MRKTHQQNSIDALCFWWIWRPWKALSKLFPVIAKWEEFDLDLWSSLKSSTGYLVRPWRRIFTFCTSKPSLETRSTVRHHKAITGVDTKMWALLGPGVQIQILCPCWNLLCLFRGRGGGPSPKVRAFCNRGWPDRGKFCGSIACPYWTGLCPYCQKTEGQEMFRLRLQPMHYGNFWNVQWAQEHPGEWS